MKIRIVKACYPTVWYANKIGEVFDATDCGTQYLLDNSLSAVYKEDCEEVIEHNSQLYRKVDHPVREGDTVLITEFDGNLINEVRRVKKLYYFSVRNDGSLWIDEKIYDEDFLDTHSDKYVIIEPIEHPEIGPPYAEVSELLHEAKETKEREGFIESAVKASFEKLPEAIGEALQRLADSDEELPTLTETDLIANLAQEVAELKRQLTNAATDIADLEDRVDENEKDTEELIGRMNDLGDGAKAGAFDFDKLLEDLSTLVTNEREQRDRFTNGCRTYEYVDGRADGLVLAINEIKEALRNA
ncbi:hypothetical protein FH832_002841 [Listeria monocytogenes]|nr:hypothetical protein [Listeria monocytogenes]